MSDDAKYMGREADQTIETIFGTVKLWGPQKPAKPPPVRRDVIEINQPLGRILIQDCPFTSPQAIADFLRQAADSVEAVKDHLRPITPWPLPEGPRRE